MSKRNTKRDKKKKSYQTWGVKRILAKRKTPHGEYEYLVEWENWTPGEYQWLPKSRLNCALLLKKFEEKLLTSPSLGTSSTASSKVIKTPAARRRSTRINKKLDEEKEENDASLFEDKPGMSKMSQKKDAEEANSSKKKRNRVSSSSSEDEAAPIKTKKDTTGDAIATETTRVLRKRPQISPNYTPKRRSAPVKLEASHAEKKEEKKTHETPSSGAGDAFFGCTPERVTRSGRPFSTGAPKTARKISKMVSNKSVKEPKRRVVENVVDDEANAVDTELDLDINLEMNNECGKEQNIAQEEAHIDELQHVVKEEVVEPETVSVHENIIAPNVAYNNAQVKEEEMDFDAVDESVVSKAPEKVVVKTVADVLHSIANEEEGLPGDKDSAVVDLPKKSDVGDKGVENVFKDNQLVNEAESVNHNGHDMCDDEITGDPHEDSIPDQPNLEDNVVILPPSRLHPSTESPSNYANDSDDGKIRNRVYEEILASLHVLMDELVEKVCVSELLDTYENISIIGVEKKGHDVLYSLNIAGESFIVGSDEVLNHQKLKDPVIKFWEKRFASTDAL